MFHQKALPLMPSVTTVPFGESAIADRYGHVSVGVLHIEAESVRHDLCEAVLGHGECDGDLVAGVGSDGQSLFGCEPYGAFLEFPVEVSAEGQFGCRSVCGIGDGHGVFLAVGHAVLVGDLQGFTRTYDFGDDLSGRSESERDIRRIGCDALHFVRHADGDVLLSGFAADDGLAVDFAPEPVAFERPVLVGVECDADFCSGLYGLYGLFREDRCHIGISLVVTACSGASHDNGHEGCFCCQFNHFHTLFQFKRLIQLLYNTVQVSIPVVSDIRIPNPRSIPRCWHRCPRCRYP